MELYFVKREDWREWLKSNYSISNGIWLVYYKKPSGKPRIPYNDAVEEALCFGWIDGKIKKINEDYYIQWFTPRRKGSRWSRINVGRVEKLISVGKMEAPGLLAFKEVLEKPALIYGEKSTGEPEIPSDLEKALKNNLTAWTNFTKFTPSARRIYIEWLNSAKRDETRVRRIIRIISSSEMNIRPGII